MESEILTLEEVAQYLRVSERTVYDWAQRGEIPAGKLGTSWRFKRSEIESWVDRKLSGRKPLDDTHTVDLKRVLTPDRIITLEAASKTDALNELVECLARAPQIKNEEELREGIFRREELMSTGIGQGIAIPHVRLDSVKDLGVALGICRTPLTDYPALDNMPVEIIIMIAAASDQHAYYLKTLAYLSGLLKDRTTREFVLSSEDTLRIYEVLTGGGK